MRTFLKLILLSLLTCNAVGQELITNIQARKITSLNGNWQYIIDPYETGFYDFRFQERKENDRDAYWNTDIPLNKTDKKEHGFTDKYQLRVPGDWNSQDPKFLYYEGTVWYKMSFDFMPGNASDRIFIYFGAVNYRADVYLNGKKLGMHKGGFTPFNFEIPDSLLMPRGNYLVVHVDNKRYKDEVPTLNTDWWNYGGITRDVNIVEVPENFICDYFIHLKKPVPGQIPATKNAEVTGWIKMDYKNSSKKESVTIEIPELKIKKIFSSSDSLFQIDFILPSVSLWSPENPKLYQVILSTSTERLVDKVGFRTVEAFGDHVLLNGKSIFMRGICIHEQIPQQIRRAYSRQDAIQLLGWAKELNCNMVRLAHYPHNENTIHVADSLGILVWSEIPVYWTIDFSDPEVLNKAKNQLKEMITRDKNRACIIIWSVGNETPVNKVRTDFMHQLISAAKQIDGTRLISAALLVNYGGHNDSNVVDDPLGQYVDLVAFNEYLGWYSGLPDRCRTAKWGTVYNKPLFISETGAEALGGFHADSLTRWSEEYQEWYFKEQIAMLHRMPLNFVGISPWILADFRSPRRNNPVYQDGWNNKGLIDQKGKKKKAFYILREFYTN